MAELPTYPFLRTHAAFAHVQHYLFDMRLPAPRQPSDVVGVLEQFGVKVAHCAETVALLVGDGLHATVSAHQGGLCLCVDVVVNAGPGAAAASLDTALLQKQLETELQPAKTKVFPPLVRNSALLDPYVPTTDKLLIQYDYDRVLFHQRSEYQDVLIMHSNQFGSMLLLDGDPNLADSDLAYTQAILGNGRYSYKDKRVLVLGGGDGGILHEVRKLEPAMVEMVEIDEVVINAAREHMRATCHDSMDQLKGPGYEIIVGDCVAFLHNAISAGTKFDFIINDLTAIPISTKAEGDLWEFIMQILDLSMQVLADDGYYITQGNGYNNGVCLELYEKQLQRLSVPVQFSKETVTVPSYHEQWVFYTISKRK